MDYALLSLIGTEAIKAVVKKVTDSGYDKLFVKTKSEKKGSRLKKIPELFEIHLTELINWSASIPFIGLNKPKDVDKTTIELSISSNISSFDNGSNSEVVSEDELLEASSNILLFGHPGAGKTTTLKRLILKYFTEAKDEYSFNVPILLRLRELREDTTIAKSILDLFGIEYYSKTIEVEELKKYPNGDFEILTKKKIVTYVEDVPIDLFVVKFLNLTKALLILDGLDEVVQAHQKNILNEVEKMGLKLLGARIIMTVRKSKVRSVNTHFTKYEIKPLTEGHIVEITKKWLSKSDQFLHELNNKPYRDLANRPIFLTLLMILYEKLGYLPPQPFEVYKEATYLIVQDWDEQRGIIRKSVYSDFNTRKKLKFLFELSYHITYRVKQKTFSTEILRSLYQKMHMKYNLPEEEMEIVIEEIESHNGIISEAHYKHYEFSHLSIQEYLCAEHLVTLPFSKDTFEYFYEYPEPLAIAICISGEPTGWFANLLLNANFNINNLRKQRKLSNFKDSLFTLITRLLIESPSFNVSEDLGFVIIYLIFEVYKEEGFGNLIVELIHYKNALPSLNLALENFKIVPNYANSKSINLKRESASLMNYFINPPYQGEFPEALFQNTKLTPVIKNSRLTITLT